MLIPGASLDQPPCTVKYLGCSCAWTFGRRLQSRSWTREFGCLDTYTPIRFISLGRTLMRNLMLNFSSLESHACHLPPSLQARSHIYPHTSLPVFNLSSILFLFLYSVLLLSIRGWHGILAFHRWLARMKQPSATPGPTAPHYDFRLKSAATLVFAYDAALHTYLELAVFFLHRRLVFLLRTTSGICVLVLGLIELID